MKTTAVLLLLQLVMAAGLAWSCFCRVNKMTGDTRREVRWAMVFEGAASLLVLGAPLLPGLMPNDFDHPMWTTPGWIWLMFLLSILSVQLVTAKYWIAGVPPQFQQDPPRRAGQGLAAAFALGMVIVSLFAPHASIAQQAPSPDPVPEPIVVLAPGEVVRCAYPGGCVSLVMPVFEFMANAALAGCPQRKGTPL